jgi:predicted nucleic acid-binding protein
MNLLLDTNVLVDFFMQRQPFYRDVIKLQVMQEFGDAELWCSAKSFSDIFYVAKKNVASEDIQKAFLVSLEFLKVCSIDGNDIKTAASLGWDDFEDCLIDVAAKKLDADFIITRDTDGFEKARTPVKTPRDLFEWLSSAHKISYEAVDLD